MSEEFVLVVNGAEFTIAAEPARSLLEVLRDELDLTGTKYGCGEGQCGACTVLLAGTPVRSCRLPVGAVEGKAIRTIEGLANGEQLHPVQQAFLEETALQCGYCTPGMILASVALLERERAPSQARIREALQGHICRCGTHPRIEMAIARAAAAQREAGR